VVLILNLFDEGSKENQLMLNMRDLQFQTSTSWTINLSASQFHSLEKARSIWIILL